MPRLALTSIVLTLLLSILISTPASSQESVNDNSQVSEENKVQPETLSTKNATNDALEEKRAAARKAREEARAEWLKVYEMQAAKEAAERAEYEAKLKTQSVTFGSIIILKHVETDKLLAGTNFKYFHRHSSGQHQIIAAASEDGYSHWRVLPKVGTRWETLKDVPVNHGDSIRLLNMRTERCLHSHSGPVSPIAGINEVTNHGMENGGTDANGNWRVWTGQEGAWTLASNVSLLHVSTRAALVSAPNPTGPAAAPLLNFTFGHQEVAARRGDFREAGPGPEGVWEARPVEPERAGRDRHLQVYEPPQDESEKFARYNEDPANGPKEISIYCPENPVVSVADLDYNLVSEGRCFALNLQAPQFESSLLLNCAPKSDGGGRSGGGGGGRRGPSSESDSDFPPEPEPEEA